MKARQVAGGWIVRLERGERIVETVHAFCADNGIKAGSVYGIGGAEWVELGFYHLDRKEYEYTTVDELVEISSLIGSVSMADGSQTLHLHATVAGSDLIAKAGHLREGVVAGTLELRIEIFGGEIQRVHSDDIGLKLLDL